MKKFALLVTLLACAPALILGVGSHIDTRTANKEKMLAERFERWCIANGYGTAILNENEGELIWVEVWQHTEDYRSACDSIDSLLSIKNYILNNP